MSPVTVSRRQADRFAAAVDGTGSEALDERTRELVGLVGSLRRTSHPRARSTFVHDLREQLMLAAQLELHPGAPEPVVRPTRSRRERRIAVALGGIAIVGATTSMAVAAQSALPGDVLYPIKRALEDADTGLSADDTRGTELLDHATSRLDELDALSQRGPVDSVGEAAIADTLATFADQAAEASELLLATYDRTGSEQAITELRTFTGRSLDALARLNARLPESLRPALRRAAQVLFVIDQNATNACPGCAGPVITDSARDLVAATTAVVQVPTRPVEVHRPGLAVTVAAPVPSTAPEAGTGSPATAGVGAATSETTGDDAEAADPAPVQSDLLPSGTSDEDADESDGAGGSGQQQHGPSRSGGTRASQQPVVPGVGSTLPTGVPDPVGGVAGGASKVLDDAADALTDLLRP